MKKIFVRLGLVIIIVSLAFVIPATLWLAGNLYTISEYSELVAGIVVVIFAFIWYKRSKSFPISPVRPLWKASCLIGCMVGFVLICINIINEPISQITRQARPPTAVISVILLLPIAEELIFRGVIWSLIENVTTTYRSKTVSLIGTSLLFGIEHLGYWAQSHWPLPPNAIYHALSMVISGIIFGALRWMSGSLIVPVLAHIIANGIVLLFQ